MIPSTFHHLHTVTVGRELADVLIWAGCCLTFLLAVVVVSCRTAR